MFAAQLIVRAHNGPNTAFFHSCFKGRQINFVQSSVADLHINMSAPGFLIVQCKMLHTSSDSVLLNAFDVGNTHFGGQ